MQRIENTQETLPRIMKCAGLAITVGGLIASSVVQAENTASGYSNAERSAVIGAAAQGSCIPGLQGYCRVLLAEVKNSGQIKDLVIGLSYETMLMTETVVGSKGGSKSSSTADAEIEMYVTVDGVMANPEEVTFDKRTQTLWAKLGGVLDCEDIIDQETGESDGIVTFDECNLTEEEIGLILDTKAAHSFNFLAYDIGSGSHTIEAYARLSKNGEVVLEDPASGSGSWDASAALGKGTLTVWEVHGGTDTGSQ